MEAFCEMIRDLILLLPLFKYVDYISKYEIVARNENSYRLQEPMEQAVLNRKRQAN